MTLENIQDQSPFNFIIFGTSSRSFTLHGVRSRNAKNNRHNSFKIIPSGFCKQNQIEISGGKKKSHWREQNFHFAPLSPPCWTYLHPLSHKELLKDKERSWQGNTQITSARWKTELLIGHLFPILYEPSQDFLLVLFMYCYYQRLPHLAILATSCGFTLQFLY